MRISMKAALCLALAAPFPAQAAPILLANGQLTGNHDLSGLNNILENGVPADFLGGVGSGIAYAGGNTYLTVPDRGPNATPYNDAIDNTASYIARFHTMTMTLTANPAGSPLAFSLTPQLDATTLLWSADPLAYGDGAAYGVPNGAPALNDAGHYYFTGRSDNYVPGTPTTNPANARLDPESIRVSNDGKSVFISDEYGPYVRQFDRATGQLVKTFTVPTDLSAANPGPTEDGEIAGNDFGRTTNKGMEGLAITPDGKTLVGIMQAPLRQDDDASDGKLLRIVTIDIETGKTKEFAYKLDAGSGVSDIVAINDHQFLVDERDGKGLGDDSKAKIKQLYVIDTSNAEDVTGKDADYALAHLVQKDASPFLDLVLALTGSPLNLDKTEVPAKIEGIAFGQDVDVNGTLMHTLWVTNDNDYLPAEAGPNQFYVFGFTDSDLPGFMQQAVPEPSTWAMMIGGFALAGAALRRRKVAVRFA